MSAFRFVSHDKPLIKFNADTSGGIATSGGVRFLGQRRSYWRLLIRGAALLMVTLGIYRFWLVTDIRRFLWSNTEIAGEALEYTGTALELLLGFLIAIALLIPVYTAFFLAALDLGLLGQLSGLIAFAALAVLGQYAIYRARRYRLTRTVYRGLRFPRNSVVDRDCTEFRSCLSVPAGEPRTLQDEKYLLRRSCRPLRGVWLRIASARVADVGVVFCAARASRQGFGWPGLASTA
jgi:uncharacterized membrane protein YjgN (DUF898 family)